MRAFLLFLLSCLPCFAQLNVQQPMFAVRSGTNHPSPIALVGWIASTGVTNAADALASDGDRVKGWSTNGNGTFNYPLTQLDTADNRRPIYHATGGANNQPYLEFPTANDHNYTWMTNKFTANIPYPLLMLAMVRVTAVGGNSGYIIDGNSARTQLYQNGANRVLSLDTDSGSVLNGGANSIVLDEWYLVSCYLKSGSSMFRTNGVTYSTTPQGATGAAGLTGISVGASFTSGYQFDGYIAGIWLYGSSGAYIHSNDVRNIEATIGTIYGISIP